MAKGVLKENFYDNYSRLQNMTSHKPPCGDPVIQRYNVEKKYLK